MFFWHSRSISCPEIHTRTDQKKYINIISGETEWKYLLFFHAAFRICHQLMVVLRQSDMSLDALTDMQLWFHSASHVITTAGSRVMSHHWRKLIKMRADVDFVIFMDGIKPYAHGRFCKLDFISDVIRCFILVPFTWYTPSHIHILISGPPLLRHYTVLYTVIMLPNSALGLC